MVFLLMVSWPSYAFVNPIIVESKKFDASELVKKSERAVAYIVKSGQATKDRNLQRNNKTAQPFWGAVKKVNTSIEKLNKYLFLKDDKFYTALSETVTNKEELITTYEMLQAKDSTVKEGIDKLSSTIDLLYQNYSKEAQRVKKGDALSAEEKEKLNELKAQNKKLQRKLNELESKVGHNKEMLKKIKKIRNKSNEVTHCTNNSAGFFFAMSAMHMINGWMWGCHWWWGSWGSWYPGFYYGYVDIYVGIYDFYAYDWGYMDAVIDGYYYDLDVELAAYEMDVLDGYLDSYDYTPELYNISNDMMDEYDMLDTMDAYPMDSQMDYYEEPMGFDYDY